MAKRQQNRTDRILLGIAVVLLVLGVLMVYSASSFRGAEKYGDSTQFLKQHLIRVAIGLVLLFITANIDYHRYRLVTPMMLFILTILLIAVLFGTM